MGIINDWIFGKEITYIDNRLGELTARIRNKKQTKECTWSGIYVIPGQQAETVIILEGNFIAPDPEQLSSLYELLDHLPELNHKVEESWKNQLSDMQFLTSGWLEKYYLSAIVSWKSKDKSFEVNFEPYDDNDTTKISLIWKDLEISKLKIE